MALTEQEELELLELEREKSTNKEQSQGMERQNILGQLLNVPGAAVRSMIRGTGYAQGAMNPSQVPTFQEEAKNITPKLPFMNIVGEIPVMPGSTSLKMKQVPELFGQVADTMTNPAELLLTLMGVKSAKALSTKKLDLSKLKLPQLQNTLTQSKKAKIALDDVRTIFGKAKELAIKQVDDVALELPEIKESTKVMGAINNPIYEVEFLADGSIKPTVGNADKVKEALGELISSPKIWEEAPKKELRYVKQLYGQVSDSMKKAAKGVGKPIDEALSNYHNFMINYNKVNKTIVDTAGEAVGNKLRDAFKWTSEPAVKEAWKEVSKVSPEINRIMKSQQTRRLLTNLIKAAGITEATRRSIKFIKP